MPYTTQQWFERGKWFLYRGNRIFYVEEGSGEPLLLLHGFPTSSWDWHKIWDGLISSSRVIALDFIGFGYSDKPPHYDYSMPDQADLVEKLLGHLGITQYHILAHDIGDTVAQELLARQLDRQSIQITSCCLLNGGLFPETHRATRTQKLLLGPFGFWIARLLNYKRFVSSFSMLFPDTTRPAESEMLDLFALISHKNGSRIMHRLIRYILERRRNRERWVTALQKASVPIRLIDGMDDPVSGAHMVDRYQQLIPKPDVIELHNCGHYPQMEKPDQVLNGYREFRKFAG
jgi:pimeloyl-ACP methyl ester carboxylesterase